MSDTKVMAKVLRTVYRNEPIARYELRCRAADLIESQASEIAALKAAFRLSADDTNRLRGERDEALSQLERYRKALEAVDESIYCLDGDRGIGISEEAEKKVTEALSNE